MHITQLPEVSEEQLVERLVHKIHRAIDMKLPDAPPSPLVQEFSFDEPTALTQLGGRPHEQMPHWHNDPTVTLQGQSKKKQSYLPLILIALLVVILFFLLIYRLK